MEIPRDIVRKIKKTTDIYKSECAINTDEAFKIINTQKQIIEDIQNFCLKSLSDYTIDKSHMKRILSILGGREQVSSPIGTSKNTQTKTRIYRK